MISIASCGISVSLSQLFLGIAFIFHMSDRDRKKIHPSLLLFSGFLLFLSFFISFFANHSFSEYRLITKSECKDFLLFSGFILTSGLKRTERETVYKGFKLLLFLLILTGIISVFTKIRLSVILNQPFRNPSGWIYTQHFGNIGNVGIYLPIGLMNTHLTFGGLLLFFFPYLLFKTVLSLKEKIIHFKSALLILLLILFSAVFALNNARSAMLGAGAAVVIGTLDLVFIKNVFSKRLFSLFFGTAAALILSAGFIMYQHPATAKTVRPLLGAEKHTDSGRTFIWSAAFNIIERHPFLGAGPGNFDIETEKSRKELSLENSRLLFFYETVQRGHAHNDIFHILAISGFPGGISFLLLFAGTVSVVWKNRNLKYAPLAYGLAGFFFAGVFQCYFQDDETVIVFWYILGFIQSASADEAHAVLKLH
ncbi:MAG TPA: O-antigen ligase family protein [Leptospiraceae bacterium]|nr:O-antigen ligase family protein [Leptospiraceae bacterium]